MRRPVLLAMIVTALGTVAAGCGGDPGAPIRRPGGDRAAAVVALAAAGREAVASPLVPGRGPWPGFGRDAAHSGSSPVVGPQRGTLRWRRHLEGAVVPGPAVGPHGLVVAASNAGVLHGIDLRTGADRWRLDARVAYGSDLSTTPAVLPGGVILWPGPADSVIAVSAQGRELWRLAFAGEPRSPAIGPRGQLVVGDAAGGLAAFDPPQASRPPRRRWLLHLGRTSYSSPAIAPDGTIYTTVDASLVAVRDGRVLWRVAAGDISETSPAIAPDGTVIFTANDDVAYGVTPGGRLRWRHPIGALTYSSPAATRDGLVYVGDHLGRVTALDARTGRVRARVHGLARTARLRSVGVWTQPIVDRRHDVYFGTRPGHVYGFASSGRRLFDIDAGATVDSYPALAADGTLLVGSEGGDLLAVSGPRPAAAATR